MAIGNPTYHTILGDSNIIQLPDKRVWNLTDGWTTLKRYTGTSDAIKAKANELASSSSGVDNIDEEITGKSGQLICKVIEDSGSSSGGNTEEANALWELIGQDILKPIEQHADFLTAITPNRKRQINKYIEDTIKATADGIPAPSTDVEKALAGYLSHQTLDFVLTQLIIRKSIILSTKSSITASYTSMNRVVTLESINPPSILLGTLTSLPLEDGTSGAWEWLKKAPQLRQVEKRKFQLIYEWWGAEKWAEIYGGSWTPSWS
jgi:hypothetical protein